MRSSAHEANERSRGQRLWRNGRNEERACEASGTTSKTGSAALDQSEGSCWWATQARFELRLRAAASAAARHTEPPGAWLPPRPEQTGVSAAPRHHVVQGYYALVPVN